MHVVQPSTETIQLVNVVSVHEQAEFMCLYLEIKMAADVYLIRILCLVKFTTTTTFTTFPICRMSFTFDVRVSTK